MNSKKPIYNSRFSWLISIFNLAVFCFFSEPGRFSPGLFFTFGLSLFFFFANFGGFEDFLRAAISSFRTWIAPSALQFAPVLERPRTGG
ncbi:MAG: hypothetical protein H6618_01235 [Deltaproteobacteria bacterium]|nr:hypothetical protein [Deltaproteobacteria bacterium]